MRTARGVGKVFGDRSGKTITLGIHGAASPVMKVIAEAESIIVAGSSWEADKESMRQLIERISAQKPFPIYVTISDAQGGGCSGNYPGNFEELDAEIRSFVNVGMEFELRIERKSNSEKNLLGSSGHELPELFRDDLKPQVAKYGLEHRPVFIRPTGAPVELANLFPNQAVFLICNGPSFNIESAAKLQAPGLVTFGMNNGANKFRPKLWACTDDPTRFVASIWRDPTVLKFVPIQHFEAPISVSGATLRPPLVRDMAAVVGVRKNDDFDPDTWLHEASINWGHDPTFGGPRSTLLFALRICHVLGFRKVYLLGCDFQMTHERAYWFRENCTKEFIEFNNQAYHGLSQLLELLKPRFDEAGFEVYNTNPHSKLTVFPFADLNDAIRRHSVCEEQDTAGMYCRPLRILK